MSTLSLIMVSLLVVVKCSYAVPVHNVRTLNTCLHRKPANHGEKYQFYSKKDWKKCSKVGNNPFTYTSIDANTLVTDFAIPEK